VLGGGSGTGRKRKTREGCERVGLNTKVMKVVYERRTVDEAALLIKGERCIVASFFLVLARRCAT
jgi:hypothetical protein